MVKISSIFVAFLENTNFNVPLYWPHYLNGVARAFEPNVFASDKTNIPPWIMNARVAQNLYGGKS